MISFSSEQVLALVASLMWPFSRIAGLMALAPLFNNATVPAPVKICFIAALAFVIGPTIPGGAALDPFSIQFALIMLGEFVIGLAMGLTMRLAFSAVEFAGDITGLTMGLGFATFFDPQSEGRTSVIDQFFAILTLMLYVSANIHLMLLGTLADSFRTLPIGQLGVHGLHVEPLLVWAGTIFGTGLQLALPMLAVLLITNTALGVLTRAAPQLNLFGIGFPVTIGVGYLMLGLALPFLSGPILGLLQDANRAIIHLTTPAPPGATAGL